jgi:hypothetical protein
MVSGGSGAAQGSKHEWNSYESYCIAHENVLSRHPFIEDHSVAIELFEFEDGRAIVSVAGAIYCGNSVILEVEKYAETKWRGRRNPRLWARTFAFRYNAHLPRQETVLRYDNGHSLDEYHMHAYDERLGKAGPAIRISREEMPHLSEVLDELQALFD